ncbi:hypothetical protein FRACYDRAFT_249970 [Fragilariopsis cylindrus CCMP1102]|uniref:Uncharacterized protein n=1 Tax=Fragilariopsis cylindrus CCMP1102 TaxID=635003 RepID=A0A1E7ERK1_9STRA|nr:hypothetical protein FRACYDRAFT_249970 [Fragilariopsis cylindrus CCMP1102]|eukprot:OEU08183.1 hypothetical protein FRACYDRAFT_249970 [Fragilariopsis cylindrus CCMP1102]
MKFFFSGKLAVLLLTVEVYHATSTSIRTSSFIETAARSYTGASSSLHYRYAAVNDSDDIEPTILTDMMRGRGRRQEEEVLDNDIIEIVTYFHLLIMNEMNGDNVDEETINKNLTVLNEAYGGMENSMYKDCNGDPSTSYETGFRSNKAADTTRMYVTELEDKSFLETIREEELINLYFLLEQGPVKIEDITSSSLEKFLQNQILEEQIMTLVERPLLGVISMVEDMGPLYCVERPCCNLKQDTSPHIPGTDPVWMI